MRNKLLPFVAIVIVIAALKWQPARAVPLDVPYVTSVVAVSSQTMVTLSTATFPSTVYSWCLEHVSVSAPTAPFNFTVFSSTNNPPLNTGTTNYSVTLSTGFYESEWPYRQPLCVPVNSILVLQSNVAGSTITYEAYTYKGWNP